MAYPDYIREKARQMRSERRMALTEIAERLAIPKTTVWYWIRDIEIVPPGRALQTPERRAARLRAARANAERAATLRTHAYIRGLLEYPELSTDPTFRDFVCMYIGEGYRRNRNRVALANSNPIVVKLADRWITRLATNGVDYAFQYHADQDPAELIRYWAGERGGDESPFRAQRKSHRGQLAGRSWRARCGVLTVGTNDTQLRSRLEAWMHCVYGEWVRSGLSGV